jgi:hypothetical protein
MKKTELEDKIEHSTYVKYNSAALQSTKPDCILEDKRRKRKRIETLFSQLDERLSMNVNFAETFDGLVTRIISKITALKMIQCLNLFVFNRCINHIKCNIF